MKRIQRAPEFHRKYKLIQQLGEGGYGAVYLCRNLISNQHRAVKIMDNWNNSNKTHCPTRMEYLPNELLIWESLSHPNIINLLEVYRDSEKGTWYLVMEYDPGFEDLFNHVDKNISLSSRDSANIIRQLVKVVYYLTLQNVDHRDLKDENILYNPVTKQIKLIDFGASAKLSPQAYNYFRGTDVYIPPEYFLTGTYRPFQASVWAIGCVSYVLLAGDGPFQTRKEVKEFTSLEQLDPSYSEKTLRLNFIRGCLNSDPNGRTLLSDLIRHPWLRV